MANFSDLPFEVRLLIAQYLPKSQLLKLKSLNSVFLKCWTDARWKRVEVYVSSDTSDSERTMKLLQRVLYVPDENPLNSMLNNRVETPSW